MKKFKILCILSIIILGSICVYQFIKKEDVYIAFDDIAGYRYQFIDSTNILKTSKILIKQSGKLSYQWWELEIDSAKIAKTDLFTYQKLMINSQTIIINNYGGIKDCGRKLNKYRFFIFEWENNIPYILPVKKIRFIME